MPKQQVALNMLAIGLRNLVEGRLQAFNNKVVFQEQRLAIGFYASIADNAAAIGELIKDKEEPNAIYEESVSLSRFATDKVDDVVEADNYDV